MNDIRKLMEAIEQINEDPTVGGNMAEVQRQLTELSRYCTELYWNYEKYPALDEHKTLVEEIRASADALRRKVVELR